MRLNFLFSEGHLIGGIFYKKQFCYCFAIQQLKAGVGSNPFNVGGKFAISASKTVLKKISDKRGP